jgi:glycerophosphoryl diester phosphodiesterase
MDSIEAVRVGIQNGADAVEVDVRLNTAGGLVLSHNWDKSMEYRGCTALAEVFELIVQHKQIGINCDIKEEEAVPAILALAENMGLGPDQLIFTGESSPRLLSAHPEICKKADVWLNVGGVSETPLDTLIAECRRLGVRALNIDFNGDMAPLIPRIIACGLQVSVWTLNDGESLKRAFALGVLNVTTRDTRLAVKARGMSSLGV